MSNVRNLVDSVRPDGCSPGHARDLGIGEVLLGAGALDRLPAVVERVMALHHHNRTVAPTASAPGSGATGRSPRTVIMCDSNTRRAAGDRVADMLRVAGINVQIHEWKPGSGDLVPHERTIGEGLIAVPPNTELLVSVGSGVVTDSTRYIAFRLGLPFINVPTAPSVDGFTSSVSPLIISGVKVTVPAKSPSAVVADTGILQASPHRLKSAGFGDFIGKLTARADWYLSHVVTGEEYCEYIVDRVAESVRQVIDAPKSQPDYPERLFEGLIVSGIGMTLVDSSRPASGAEHHISHFFELQALRHELPHYYHGETVGLGTYLVAALYHKVLGDRGAFTARVENAAGKWTDPARRESAVKKREALLDASFGPIAPTMKESFRAHIPDADGVRDLRGRLVAVLDAVEPAVREHLPDAAGVRAMFDAAGLRYRFSELEIPRDTVRAAVICAKEIRDRFTILALLENLGVLEEYADEVVNELYE